ncbi:MAG: hypothetical protein JEZ00_07230 [Anaerolineaceae bacterium]|nr:hypothetical protein [Anaerolineaceae bacterium]
MKIISVFLILLSLLLLAGCNMPDNDNPGTAYLSGDSSPQAWIDAPLNESYLSLAPYTIVYHISDQVSVAVGELSINGRVVASLPNPNPSKKLATLKVLWDPPAPGEYLLSVRAQGADGAWGSEAQSVVYIGDGSATPTLLETPTPTPTPTPTLTPTPEIATGFSNFSASPGAVHYGNCSPNQVSVSAIAVDPAGITTVVLFYRMRDNNGQVTEWSNTNMNPGSNDQYSKTINLNSFDSPHTSGTLDIQLVIQNKNSDLLRSEVYSQVGITGCFQPLFELESTKPSLIPLFPTSTPIIIK